MITLYWGLQYAAVLCGYVFLLFVWPRVVFYRHLTGKGKIYRFSFCVTVQLVLINTVVLVFGLVHILNRWTIMVFFYGAFLIVLMRRYHINGQFIYRKIEGFRYLVTGAYGRKRVVVQGVRRLGSCLKKGSAGLWDAVKPHLGEYALLVIIIGFGMIYFSYGAFQHYSYGFGDMYTHHSWIYALTEGNIFSAGVYPEGMHCFVFAIYALFGIKVYSILLFLAGIHSSVLLLAVYAMLREIFNWRYTPFFVLMLLLTLDVCCVDEIFSMSRLQWTLPQEFGMYTQFLCALYLVRFLKSTHQIVRKEGRPSKFYWDDNLFLFTMSLAASIAIHFYITMMAFFLCFSFAILALYKVFCRKRIVPLICAVLCGLLIAALPMAGALVSGIPMQGSIGWAINVINGTDANVGRAHSATSSETEDVASETEPTKKTTFKESAWKATLFCKEKVQGIYKEGYRTLYGDTRARWIIVLTGLAAILWLLYRLGAVFLARFSKIRVNKSCFDSYGGIILASCLFMLVYAAPLIGLPELIAGARVCSTEQFLILTVVAMPADMFFSLLALIRKSTWIHILQIVSICCTVGIYVATIMGGNYHGYLFYELSRYNAAVMTANSIIQDFPKNSYTIVSPTDELYEFIGYGWHEELSGFAEKIQSTEYILPTEYVFLYVEKKPIYYAQFHFCKGPSWLATEKYSKIYPHSVSSQCPTIRASKISREAAQKELQFSDGWSLYTNLENRTALESKVYEWCREFSRLYPFELKTYYEDEDFVCYYFRQEPNSPYNLAIK